MQIKVRRTVPFSPEQVFARLADPTGWPWGGRVEHVAGRGVGATYRVTDRIGPHEVVSTLVLTAFEPPDRLAWRIDHEAFEHQSDLRIEPRGRGTRLVAVDEDRWHHAPWWTRWSARGAVKRDMQRRLAAIETALARKGREAE